MDRRQLLIQSSGTIVFGTALTSACGSNDWSTGAEDQIALAYPETRVSPTPKSIGGVEWIDDYAWLQQDTEEVLAWQRAQHDLAGAYLREGDEYDYAFQRLDRTGGKDSQVFSPVRNRSGTWFSLENDVNGAYIKVFEDDSDPGRVVLRDRAKITSHLETINFVGGFDRIVPFGEQFVLSAA